MLSRLLGKKFNCVSRTIDMLCLFLGEDFTFTGTRGQKIDVAEFSLHFQAQWRFREDMNILLASRDVYEPYCENIPEDWQFDLLGRSDELSSVFDVQLKALIVKMREAIVTDVHLSAANDLSITFSNGVIFEQFMPASRKDEEWRLIDYKNDMHIICYDKEGCLSYE